MISMPLLQQNWNVPLPFCLSGVERKPCVSSLSKDVRSVPSPIFSSAKPFKKSMVSLNNPLSPSVSMANPK